MKSLDTLDWVVIAAYFIILLGVFSLKNKRF